MLDPCLDEPKKRDLQYLVPMKNGIARYWVQRGKYYLLPITALQVIIDLAVLVGSFLVGYYIYTHIMPAGYEPRIYMYKKLIIISAVAGLVIFERFGLYRRQMSILNIDEIRRSFRAVLILALVIFTYNFYSKSDFSRLILTYSIAILMLAVITERMIFFKLYQYLHLKGRHVNNVLIYGSGKVGQQLFKKIRQSPKLGYRAVGFIDDQDRDRNGDGSTGQNNRVDRLGGPEDLAELVTRFDIQELFIAIPSMSTQSLQSAISLCEKVGIRYSFVPNLFGFFIESVRFKEIDGIPLISTRKLRLSRLNRVIKRVFDVGVSLLVLLLSLPLMGVLALIVRLTSRGPAIFKQERVGRGGKPFVIYKFRTMYTDTPGTPSVPKSSTTPASPPSAGYSVSPSSTSSLSSGTSSPET